jgi:hypothetical protein
MPWIDYTDKFNVAGESYLYGERLPKTRLVVSVLDDHFFVDTWPPIEIPFTLETLPAAIAKVLLIAG